ncbi:MAG: hypothetical protein M3322_05500 [Actinomycetota bacterium]|nr:hypothetical protein [Actinomycetota bacterium]
MAWLNGVKVVALWSNHQPSNVHGWIDGSWRKFEDVNDDACTNFAILAAHAKDGNRNVNVRVESGRVKEMYVW